MTEVGLWLLVVGLSDLVRAARDVTSGSRRLLMAAAGVSLLCFAVVAQDLAAGRAVQLLAGWVVCFLLWLLGSASALTGGGVLARTAAFSGLAGGVAFSMVAGGLPVDLAAFPGAFGQVPAERLLVVLGVAVAQLATANVAVRLLLDAVGVPAASNEKRLRGGRVLGPMERLFIVGLGLAGQLTAAAVVVAAKGLLRFPELQRGAEVEGPSDVTEYFLIGSFASWLVAFGGLGLVALS